MYGWQVTKLDSYTSLFTTAVTDFQNTELLNIDYDYYVYEDANHSNELM